MPTPMDLTRFGIPGDFPLRGTIKSNEFVEGKGVIFLFGERHTIKPFIRANILNAIHLWDRDIVSCVGVEGPFPEQPIWCGSRLLSQVCEELKEHSASTLEQLVDSLLTCFPGANSFFAKIVGVLRPALPLAPVEDDALYSQTRPLDLWYKTQRRDHIIDVLGKSELFSPTKECVWHSDDKEKEAARANLVREKADFQWEQEFGEEAIHLKRDEAFLENLLKLWEASGRGKAAILNAGTSHQYRIARKLKQAKTLSYIHIEQP